MTTATVRCGLAQYKHDVRSRFRPVRRRAGQRFVERICGRAPSGAGPYYRPVDPTVASIREGLAAWLGRWEQAVSDDRHEPYGALVDALTHVWGLQSALEHADNEPGALAAIGVELYRLRARGASPAWGRDGKPDDHRAVWRELSHDGRSWRRFPAGRPLLALLIVEALRGERIE